jgi:hypothetical protein
VPAQTVTSINVVSLFSNVVITTGGNKITSFPVILTNAKFTFDNAPLINPYIQSIKVNVIGYPVQSFTHPVPYDPFTKYTSILSSGLSNLNSNTRSLIVKCSILPDADTSNITYSNATMNNYTFSVPNVYNVFTCTNIHSYYIVSNSTTFKNIKVVPTYVSNTFASPTSGNLISYSGILTQPVYDFTFSGNTKVLVDGSPVVPHSTVSGQINIYGDSTTVISTDLQNLITNKILLFTNAYSNVDVQVLPSKQNAKFTVTGSIVNIQRGTYKLKIVNTSFATIFFDDVQYIDGSTVFIEDNTINTTQFTMNYDSTPPTVTISLVNTTLVYNIVDVCRTIKSIEIPAFINSNTAVATYKTYLL